MSRPFLSPLSVEDRLRILATSLDALRAVGELLAQTDWRPPSPCTARPTRRAFRAWTILMARALTVQVEAIKRALPGHCLNTPAPTRADGGAK